MNNVRFSGTIVVMPRLREETYAARRQHILDSARTCFSRRGFHAASMMDLQEEAGVSAGAIYVYFPGKADIVNAITEANLAQTEAVLSKILQADPAPSFRDALLQVVTVVDKIAKGPTAGIAFDVWGEASRDPQVGKVVKQRFAAIRMLFADLAARAVKSGDLPKRTDTKAAGAALFAQAVLGYYTLRLTSGDVRPQAYVDGIVSMLKH
jgi:AcrR family transcriptional regulator